MHKKSLYFVLAIIATVVTLTGCCGSANDYIEDESLLSSVSAEIINGELPPLKTQDGTSLTAEKDTFGKRAVVSIIVKAFTGEGSDYLDNADKIYELRGFLKSDNPSEKDIKITSIEKPVSVILKNNFSGNAETRYIGIRETGHSDWSFTNVDKFSNNNSSRAYLDGSDIVYQTNRLGIEVALFAKTVGSEKLQVSTTVSDVNVSIGSASQEKPAANKIKINGGRYDDNMKVFVVPAGNGVNNLGAGDFTVELTYMNNDGSNEMKVAGIDAVYEQPAKTSGTGDNYVHRILVHNFNGTSDMLNFVLSTDKVSVDQFPMNFTIVVKNSDRLRPGALPFDYSDNVKIEELKGPKAPADIAASSEKILYGGKITITWKPGEDVSGLTYDLMLSRDGEAETAVAENISETTWSSSEGEDALKEGSYKFRILVRDSDGQTTYSDYYGFSVVASSEQPEILNLKDTYPCGKPVEIAWTEVNNPLGGDVKYAVNVEDTNGETVKSVLRADGAGSADGVGYCDEIIGGDGIVVTAVGKVGDIGLRSVARKSTCVVKVGGHGQGGAVWLTWENAAGVIHEIGFAEQFSREQFQIEA